MKNKYIVLLLTVLTIQASEKKQAVIKNESKLTKSDFAKMSDVKLSELEGTLTHYKERWYCSLECESRRLKLYEQKTGAKLSWILDSDEPLPPLVNKKRK